ncbi:glycosyl transferase family 51 [Catenulispora acidiphila DSM 44928]|uniref:Glycosyl transferase family 51 n=1 Tax=Catenulispora acidiphila (strain DSM 44928 / JCM 14897 / NBRC 102108 / NRRL B-24433 / ID139908) TaxID=479433 RepID=C7Q3W7_CATAD|nr:transglycosylase domain-containing protein [Catenulispora acidiphila]ACU77725.1 glycosyl transferase family 51 [Catenulispora acidiphila DSM 44928]
MASHPPRPFRGNGPLRALFGLLMISALAGVLVAGMALPFVGTAGLAAKSASDHFEDIPDDLKTPDLPQRSQILAADGSVMATVWGDFGNRVIVPFNAISPNVWQALVATEDSRFFSHGGIDMKGTLRAFVSDLGGSNQGGSSISQQYVKNVLVLEAGNDKAKYADATGDSMARKVRELKYAIAVEQKFSKTEILERYLNLVPFAENVSGIETAADRWFGVHASQLTVPQAATLIGMLKNPVAYDPAKHPQAATDRRNTVLDRMADPTVHYITPEQAAAFKAMPLGLNLQAQHSGCIYAPGSAAFFCEYIEQEILNDPIYGKTKADRAAFFNRGGLTIKTTMDPKMEASAEKAINDNVSATDLPGAAIAMIQPGTGQIKAMAQSRNMGTGAGQTYLNLAADPAHGGGNGYQAGSTFKSFVAMAAMEKGLTPDYVQNLPYQIDETQTKFTTCDTPQGITQDPKWKPTDETQGEAGPQTMTSALWNSVNNYFIKLQEQTGLCEPARLAAAAGLTIDSDNGAGKRLEQIGSFTLGTNQVTPIAMANAYATIAARGMYCKPTAVISITDTSGKQYPVATPDCHQTIDPSLTDQLTGMLQGVVDKGTGSKVKDYFSGPAAGKTGTNDSRLMTWFDGYTPNLAAAVWVGEVSPKPGDKGLVNLKIHGQYYSQVCGGCLAAPIWGQAVKGALAGTSVPDFAVPELSGEIPPPTQPTPPPGQNNPPGQANGGQNGGGNGGFIGGFLGGQ